MNRFKLSNKFSIDDWRAGIQRDKRLNPDAKLVAMALSSFYREGEPTCPTIDQIAAKYEELKSKQG